MDQQVLEHLSAGRLRRDVQGLRETLAGLAPGQFARVIVRSNRYGLYVVDGTVRHGVGGQPMIADVFLTTAGEIQRIIPEVPLVDSTSASPSVGTEFAHGDVVRATFSTPTHGTFQVTGPLTAGQDRFLLVGSWIVFNGGEQAPRVLRVDRINDVEVHPTNVPPLRSSMEEEQAPSSDEAA